MKCEETSMVELLQYIDDLRVEVPESIATNVLARDAVAKEDRRVREHRSTLQSKEELRAEVSDTIITKEAARDSEGQAVRTVGELGAPLETNEAHLKRRRLSKKTSASSVNMAPSPDVKRGHDSLDSDSTAKHLKLSPAMEPSGAGFDFSADRDVVSSSTLLPMQSHDDISATAPGHAMKPVGTSQMASIGAIAAVAVCGAAAALGVTGKATSTSSESPRSKGTTANLAAAAAEKRREEKSNIAMMHEERKDKSVHFSGTQSTENNDVDMDLDADSSRQSVPAKDPTAFGASQVHRLREQWRKSKEKQAFSLSKRYNSGGTNNPNPSLPSGSTTPCQWNRHTCNFHASSDTSVEFVGCSRCGYLCHVSADDPLCAATHCKRNSHRCLPLRGPGGCSSCGRRCHDDNTDERCDYFMRQHGLLEWEPNEQDRMDTMQGTGGSLPHRTQVSWSFTGLRDYHHSRILMVDGKEYFEGYGNPGRGIDGEINNCLIDSIRQCLNLVCDRRIVREHLMKKFSHHTGRAQVTKDSFLDVEEHGLDIIQLLYQHNLCGEPKVVDPSRFCIIGLFELKEGEAAHGVVVGNAAAPLRIVVLNIRDAHFNPVLQRIN